MPDEGLSGLLDFVGYPIGAATQVAPSLAGFYGLLDFTGVPMGVPSIRPAASVLGGRRPPRHVELWVQEQVAAERNRVWHSVLDKIQQRRQMESWLRKIEAEYQQKCLQWAAYSVLLSEL